MTNDNKRLKLLFKDAAIFAIGGFGSKILTFLLVPLYTNLLTTAEYGIANLLFTTITVLYPIFTVAISEGALRFAMEQKYKNNEVLAVTLLFNLLGVLALFLAYPIFFSVSGALSQYWWYFLIYYFGVSLHNSLAQFLKGTGKTKLFAAQGIIQTLILVTLNIVFLVFFGFGLHGYLMASILGYWLTILFIVLSGGLLAEVPKLRLNKVLTKEMLYYSVPMIPTIVAWWANSAIDKYIIVAVEGLASNGLYSIAGKIPAILSIVTSLFSQAWQLSAISNHEAPDFENYFNKVYYAFFVVNITVTTLFVIINKLLCSILFSGDFYSAWIFVPFLLMANLFSSMSGILASAFRASKKTKMLFVSTLIGALVNLVLNIILVRNIGAIGAALATLLSFLVVWLIRMVSVQNLVSVRLPVLSVTLSIALALAVCLVFVAEVKYAYIISICLFLGICVANYSELCQLIAKVFFCSQKLFEKIKIKTRGFV